MKSIFFSFVCIPPFKHGSAFFYQPKLILFRLLKCPMSCIPVTAQCFIRSDQHWMIDHIAHLLHRTEDSVFVTTTAYICTLIRSSSFSIRFVRVGVSRLIRIWSRHGLVAIRASILISILLSIGIIWYPLLDGY